jgi:hypothetical protein
VQKITPLQFDGYVCRNELYNFTGSRRPVVFLRTICFGIDNTIHEVWRMAIDGLVAGKINYDQLAQCNKQLL